MYQDMCWKEKGFTVVHHDKCFVNADKAIMDSPHQQDSKGNPRFMRVTDDLSLSCDYCGKPIAQEKRELLLTDVMKYKFGDQSPQD